MTLSDRRLAEVIAVLPAAAVGLLYLLLLGHRHDYLGHYAAGYGASYAALAVWLRSLPRARNGRLAQTVVLAGCALCIAAGAITEATIFRLARFDEIDFCNQSLGAVLAAAAALAFVREPRPADREFDVATIIGIVFLTIGGWFAFA
jgi:ABC-type cobalamin transport system permease subunit